MRVLQIIHTLELAGAEVLVHDLVVGLNRRGVECSVYLLQSTGSQMQRSLLGQGVAIHGEAGIPLYSPRHVWRLAAHLRAYKYDVLNVHLFPAQLWAAIAVNVAKNAAPLVITEHSAYNYRRKRIYRPLDHWIYTQSQAIACVSDATRDALVNWIPAVAPKAVTCPNGIHLEAFANVPAQSPEQWPDVDNCPMVLSVGRLMPQKDHATTIRAIARHPNAHLCVVGVGPDLAGHQALARDLGIAERIHFLRHRADIPQLMKASDIFVQSSRFEGFGIAALEAMASGLPVVASRVPGLAELVAPAGILFEPGNDHELASHIHELLINADLRARLGDAGRRRACEFSIEKTVDSYENLYRDLTGQHAPAVEKRDTAFA